ncbi:hypothetical protein T08_8552 [Trichinella sp. T8]|nr:hypothetical protein T08_8552 [Trichinella sp. T8]
MAIVSIAFPCKSPYKTRQLVDFLKHFPIDYGFAAKNFSLLCMFHLHKSRGFLFHSLLVFCKFVTSALQFLLAAYTYC